MSDDERRCHETHQNECRAILARLLRAVRELALEEIDRERLEREHPSFPDWGIA